MFGKRLRKRVLLWLRKRGVIVRRVNYRTEAPTKPLDAQAFLLKRMGVERPVIFDVGANLGNVTARYRTMFPQAEIYSFEPFPTLYEGLVKRFAGDEHVHVLPLAVSNEVGSAEFHLTGFHTTNSLLPRAREHRRYYPQIAEATNETITVETISLDVFCAERQIERVDVLKFDIQGGEKLALAGATEVLRHKGLKLIFTESALIQHYEGEGLFYEIADFVAGYTFSLYDLYHLYRGRNGQLRYCEAIFISPELRAKALDTFAEEP